MRKFVVTTQDLREFHITASDRFEAKRIVYAITQGRCSVDLMTAREVA